MVFIPLFFVLFMSLACTKLCHGQVDTTPDMIFDEDNFIMHLSVPIEMSNGVSLPSLHLNIHLIGTSQLNPVIESYCATSAHNKTVGDFFPNCFKTIRDTAQIILLKHHSREKLMLNSKKNKDQFFVAGMTPVDLIRVEIGRWTYGWQNIQFRWWGETNSSATIGRYCQIADNINFFLGGNHRYKRVSMFPFEALWSDEIPKDFLETLPVPNYSKGPIVVG